MNDLKEYFRNNRARMIHKWAHYFEVYERHLAHYRGKQINLLEIGVYQGGSLQMWKQYFGDKATIWGIDINPLCTQFAEDHVNIRIGDQGDETFLESIAAELPRLDVLIDDGGHTMQQQRMTLKFLYPRVADEGVYICEDLHTSYWPEYGGGYRDPHSFIEFSKSLIDDLHAWHSRDSQSLAVSSFTRSTFALHFYDSILVIEKRPRERPRDRRTGMTTIPDSAFLPPPPRR